MIVDQAENLRRWVKRKELGIDLGLTKFMEGRTAEKRLIIFLGDDEEVIINSNLVANFAVALTEKGRRLLILDTYKGEIDSSIPLGIRPQVSLEDVLYNHKPARDFVYTGSNNVKFIKVKEVMSNLDKLDVEIKRKFFNLWINFEEESDLILINTSFFELALIASKMVIISSVSNRALTSIYTNIKRLTRTAKDLELFLIINMAYTEKEASACARKFTLTVKKFLGVDIQYLGFVLFEPEIVRALKAQVPFVLKYPYCSAAANLRDIALKMEGIIKKDIIN